MEAICLKAEHGKINFFFVVCYYFFTFFAIMIVIILFLVICSLPWCIVIILFFNKGENIWQKNICCRTRIPSSLFVSTRGHFNRLEAIGLKAEHGKINFFCCMLLLFYVFCYHDCNGGIIYCCLFMSFFLFFNWK